MKRPNFLVIGAAKSGTTAVWHYLKQHPQIYVSPRKHTKFFSYGMDAAESRAFRGPAPGNRRLPYAVTSADAYNALFSGVTGEIAVGEASHSYMYNAEAARRIRGYDPGMRLIAVLRDPAGRAYSHYKQMVRDGREAIGDFARALEAEQGRVGDNWWPDFHYVRIGLYHEQLERYFELFERDQIRVYLYEDLKSDPRGMLRDIFWFLGVDDAFVPETAVRYNASGIPRNRLLHGVLQRLRSAQPIAERLLPKGPYRLLLRAGGRLHNRNLVNPELSPEVRRMVIRDYFREDILKLQPLIRRDLSHWLE